jgi:hypothetical protein
MNAFELIKTHYEFNHLDESSEFKEYIDYVFEGKNTIYLVFKKGNKGFKNPKSHITKYYKSRGWMKVKFFKQ